MNKILSSKLVLVRVLLYSVEVWILRRILVTFENKVLRKIRWACIENNQWRIRKNKELRYIYKTSDIVRVIRTRSSKCLGHLLSLKGTSLLRRSLENNPKVRRPHGRPRLNWKNRMENVPQLVEGCFDLELIYLYFPPSSHLIYVCFCPVGLSLL